jgi:ATP-dependent Lon protease
MCEFHCGLRDESEIRGHRKRILWHARRIIQSLKAGTSNGFVLDEIELSTVIKVIHHQFA